MLNIEMLEDLFECLWINLNLQTSKNSKIFSFIELLQCVFTLNNYGVSL